MATNPFLKGLKNKDNENVENPFMQKADSVRTYNERPSVIFDYTKETEVAPKKSNPFSSLLPNVKSGISNANGMINSINPTLKKAVGNTLLNASPLGMVNNVAKLGGTDLKGMYGLDAMKEYNETHQDTPTAIKPLGFLMESANRVPLAQRIKVGAGNYLDTPAINFDGSTMEAKSTGNKLLDKTADFAGGLAGQALVGNGQINMLNATDDIAQYAGNKIGGKLLPSLVRGATDAAAGTILEDIGKGKGLKETAKDTALNAAFGAGLFGLGKIGSEILQGRGGDLITTSKNTYGEGINKIDSSKGLDFKQNGQLVRREGLQGLPSPRDYTQKVNELPSNNDVIPLNSRVDASSKNTIPRYDNGYVNQNALGYEIGDNVKITSDGRTFKGNVKDIDYLSEVAEVVGEDGKRTFESLSDITFDSKKIKPRFDVIDPKDRVKYVVDGKEVMGTVDTTDGFGYANVKVDGSKKFDYVPFEDLTRIDEPVQLPNKPQESVKPNLDINAQPSKLNTPTASNEAINPSIGATDRTQSYVMLKSSKNENKRNFNQLLNDFYTRTIDINNPLKNIDDKTYTLATNTKKAGGSVRHMLENSLVDRQGNKIGESLKSIATDIPKGKENDFMYYVLHKHNIDRTSQGKPIFPDFDSIQSDKAAKLLEQESPEFKAVGDRLVKFINQFEDEWGNKSGLISDDLWQKLQDTYKNYIPTNRSFEDIEQGIASTQGRGFVNQNTPLNKATGSARDVINPIENIMRLVDRTVRTARYNEVGQSFVKALRKDSSLSKFAEILPSSTEINPNVKNIVTVLEGGEPVNVQVNDKRLLEALQGLYKSKDLNAIEEGAKAFNGVFKALITTKNPVFAVRNIMRDLPTGYVNSKEKNPVKYLADWLVATKDLAANTPVAQKYRALGGESANFLNTNKLYKSADDIMGRKLVTDKDGFITGSKQKNVLLKGLKWAGDKIESLNSITESAPRLAEFKRIYQKTGDIQKALYEAGEVTTNFSRGGDLTKWADIFIPYLNAGVQGLDKLARQMDPRNPKQFVQTLIKGGIGIGAPTLAFHYMNMDNPYYTELDNRTKDNYFLIPNGFGEKDEDGIPKTFIKIPKSREYGVLFSSLFQRLHRASQGEQDAFKGFGQYAATNFSPANPLENNLAAPLLNLKGNKDFAGRDIVPTAMLNDERSKYLQYDEKTSEVTKLIAENAKKAGLDLSPKQLDYLIKSYTGIIGQVGLPATTKSTMQSGNQLQKTLKPVTTQFVSDPLYSNQAITDFYDNLQIAKKKASDNNLLNKIPSKTVTTEESLRNQLNKIQTQMSDLNKEIILADQENDQAKIKELRARMLNLAKEGNKIYNNK